MQKNIQKLLMSLLKVTAFNSKLAISIRFSAYI